MTHCHEVVPGNGTSSVHDTTMHSATDIKDNVFKRSHEARRDAHMPESYWTTESTWHIYWLSLRRPNINLAIGIRLGLRMWSRSVLGEKCRTPSPSPHGVMSRRAVWCPQCHSARKPLFPTCHHRSIQLHKFDEAPDERSTSSWRSDTLSWVNWSIRRGYGPTQPISDWTLA